MEGPLDDCPVPPADAPLSELVRLRVLIARVATSAMRLRGDPSTSLGFYSDMWNAVPSEAAEYLSGMFCMDLQGSIRRLAAEFARLRRAGADLSQPLHHDRYGCPKSAFAFVRLHTEHARAVHKLLLEAVSGEELEASNRKLEGELERISSAARALPPLEEDPMYIRRRARFVDGLARIRRELQRRRDWSALRVAWIAAVVRR